MYLPIQIVRLYIVINFNNKYMKSEYTIGHIN